MRIMLLLLCALVGSLSAAGGDEKKRGGESRIGLQLAYLQASTNTVSSEGLQAAFTADYMRTTRWGVAFGGGARASYSVGSAPRDFFVQGVSNLSSVRPIGSMNVFVDYELRLGYYLLRTSRDKPLYIGTGIRVVEFGNVNAYALRGATAASHLPIELRGDYRLSDAWGLEYLLAYDIPMGQSITYLHNGKIKAFEVQTGFGGVRLAVGARRYVSERVYFFSGLVAEYYGFSGGASYQVTNPSDTNIPGLVKGASATASYPASQVGYVGLQLGIGY